MSSPRSLSARILAAVCGLLALPAAHAAWQLNLPPGVTEISRRTYDLLSASSLSVNVHFTAKALASSSFD